MIRAGCTLAKVANRNDATTTRTLGWIRCPASTDLSSTPRIIGYKVKELGIDYTRYRRKRS